MDVAIGSSFTDSLLWSGEECSEDEGGGGGTLSLLMFERSGVNEATSKEVEEL